MASGTSVSIVVSNGPKPDERVEVVSFVGHYESELTSWASANGMYVNRSGSEYSDSYAKGVIISQSPASGKLDKGSTVSYVVSLGSKPQGPGGDGETGESD